MSTTFGNEAPAWSQGTIDSRNHLVGLLDPMQHRIAEDGVEFLAIGQCHRVNNMRSQAKCACGFDERGTRIDRYNIAPEIGDFLGENAVAAPEVKDAFAGLWSQQLQHRRS
jgi:hypothetical protein